MTIASRSLNQSKITSPSKFSSIGWIAVQNWVDRLIFPELKEDSSQLASARLLIVSTWAVLLVIVLSSIRDLLLGDIPRIWLACATAVPMFLLLRLLRRTGNLALCCNLFLTVIVLSLSIRTTLNPDGSQVMVSICALGLMAAHLISARVGFYWTLAATGIAAVNAWRLTISNSAEFEVAWAVTIMTAALGFWSCAHALGREVAKAANAQAMQQAAEERERIRIFAETVFPGIIEVAPGRIDYASDGVTQLLGYPVAEFIENGLQHYVHPDDFWPVVNTLQDAHKQVALVEARLRHARGHWIWIAAFAIPYSKIGDDDRWIFAARDVERERQDRDMGLQQERLAGVGLLAAGVAHDFNNLLTVVAGSAELLPDSQHRNNILLAADEAAGLTGRLMSFGQEQPRTIRDFDLQNQLAKLKPILTSILGEQIQLTLDDSVGPYILCADPTQFDQIVLNLVTNAKDAMPNGGTLKVALNKMHLDNKGTTPELVDSNQFIEIAIRDDGIGMDEDTLAKAFDPFFTTKDGERGSGLGLASAYRLASRSGGQLRLTSKLGVGTTAILRMPTSSSSIENSTEMRPVNSIENLDGWVLIAEDDAKIRELICEALSEVGVETHSVSNGELALAEYDKHSEPPILLVTDVMMPGMRGSTLANQLREQQPDLNVLFISGYADVELDPLYADDPSVSFLAKPFRPSELVQQAKQLIG